VTAAQPAVHISSQYGIGMVDVPGCSVRDDPVRRPLILQLCFLRTLPISPADLLAGWNMAVESTSVLVWRNELSALQERLGKLFGRPEPRRQVGLYLEGLLSATERKNGWQLAEQIGDARPWRTQRVLSHALWDADAAQELCRDYVVEHLGASDGVLIVDG